LHLLTSTLRVPRKPRLHLDKHYPRRYLKFCTLAHVLEYKINFIMRASSFCLVWLR
jgi:hypothetical protein